tara:strand:+ start:75 stop:998 length:924 start_codon:yes stop_codon:yes gene_type:complete
MSSEMFKKIVFSIISLFFLLLLFVDVNNVISERLINALWPIGHMTVFLFWSALLLLYQPKIKAAPLKKQLLILTLFCFTFGIMIELIQPFFSRSREVEDLFLNYVGVLLSIILFSRQLIHWFYKIAYFGLLSYLLFPSLLTIYDEIRVQVEFPVLASFQQNIALTRWKSDQPLSLSTPKTLASLQKMMKITFVPQKYSGVALRYFKGDWQAYKSLTISFYNPNQQSLPLTLILTDRHYNKGKPNYQDRYENKLQIEPGFNEKTIPLSSISDGVMLRKMDLSKMAGVDFYMYQLDVPVPLYLNSLYLH